MMSGGWRNEDADGLFHFLWAIGSKVFTNGKNDI